VETLLLPAGSVHGRFQPFHNEHLEYVMAALAQCQFLWIGITKYDVETEVSPLGRDREKPENNPLSYIERVLIISETLCDLGVGKGSFSFIPFPIEHPQKLRQFLQLAVPCFTTVCEPWNLEKIKVLREQGYEVRVLWDREKTITGQSVRERILSGDPSWREDVPPATTRAMELLKIVERLRRLREPGTS